MPMIMNIHRNSKRKSFTFPKTIDFPVEFTNLYYRPSSFYSLRENIYQVMVSTWLPTPCVRKNSVSDALCGINKQRLLKTAEKATIAL